MIFLLHQLLLAYIVTKYLYRLSSNPRHCLQEDTPELLPAKETAEEGKTAYDDVLAFTYSYAL